MPDEHPFTRFWLHPRRHLRLTDALFGGWTWIARMGTAGPGTRHARRFGAFGNGSAFSWPPGPAMNEHLVHIGAATLIGPEVTLSVGMWPGEELETADGWVIRVGDRVNIGRRCAFVARQRIDIGDDVTFGPDVYVTDHNHRYDDPETPVSRQWVDADPVTIGNGSWLGAKSVILPGTTLGENVAIAAGSVVRGEIPDNAVAAGVPAKVIRHYENGKWTPPLPNNKEKRDPPKGWQ
jgi:acetyltransferase-like isoleucine patch superfamily enzyme